MFMVIFQLDLCRPLVLYLLVGYTLAAFARILLHQFWTDDYMFMVIFQIDFCRSLVFYLPPRAPALLRAGNFNGTCKIADVLFVPAFFFIVHPANRSR
jgi:hypothetical protein